MRRSTGRLNDHVTIELVIWEPNERDGVEYGLTYEQLDNQYVRLTGTRRNMLRFITTLYGEETALNMVTEAVNGTLRPLSGWE